MKVQDVCDQSIQEKILQVTIDLIDFGDDTSLTVRQIAGLAGVNVGAVNYYFGSKDELLDLATKRIMQRIQDCFILLDDKSLPPVQRLENFLIQFVSRAISCKSSFYRQFFQNEQILTSKREFASHIKENGLGKIKSTIMEITGDPDESHGYLLALQLYSAIAMPNLLMSKTKILQEMQLPPIEEQIHTLLARLFQ